MGGSGTPTPPAGSSASGNLANLINDITHQNTAAINGVSDAIGTLADVSGAVGAVFSIISLLTGQGDQTQQELQQIITAIQNDFQQLQAEQRATNIINKLTDLGNQLAAPQAILDDLQKLLSLQPPLSDADRQTKIESCIAGILALAPDANWEQVYGDQVYWTDAGNKTYALLSEEQNTSLPCPQLSTEPIDRGYGEQAPAGQPDGTVFSYTYILPAYLDALFIFLTVAAALDPTFASDYADTVIRPAATLLQANHDKILNQGIKQLAPPQWDGAALANWINNIGSFVVPGITGMDPTHFSQSMPNCDGFAGASIEYGAVEQFSGYSSVADYEVPLSSDAFSGTGSNLLSPNSTDPGPYRKFQLRVLRKAKGVYVAVGFETVWNVINQLKGLVGDPLLTRPNFGDWSFRQISGAVQVANPDGSISLMALANFVQGTPPFDTPPPSGLPSVQPSGPGFTSMRALLEPA